MREQLLPWLVNESVGYLDKQEKIQKGFDRLFSNPVNCLVKKHDIFLKKESDRLAKIEDDKRVKAENKAIKRAEKKENRRLVNMSAAKTTLYNTVEKEIINKMRSDSFDPFGIRMVDFDGNRVPNEYVLVVPGGFILQLWMMFSIMRYFFCS